MSQTKCWRIILASLIPKYSRFWEILTLITPGITIVINCICICIKTLDRYRYMIETMCKNPGLVEVMQEDLAKNGTKSKWTVDKVYTLFYIILYADTLGRQIPKFFTAFRLKSK